MADAADEMSKSAKRRAAKKARDAAASDAAPELDHPAPAPAPAAKPKAKVSAKSAGGAASAPAAVEPKAAAAAPKESAKAKAKAEAKATAAAAPPQKEAAPEAKAKAKAKGKAEPKAEPTPKAAASEKPAASAKAGAKAKAGAVTQAAAAPAPAAAPEVAAKAASKGKAKSKAKAHAQESAVEEPKKDSLDLSPNYQIDDGSGPAWEVSTGVKKGQQKRKEKDDQKEAPANNSGKKKSDGGGAATQSAPMQQQLKTQTHAPKTSLEAAAAEVERILNMKAPAPEVVETVPTGPQATATVTVPEKRVGIVIGPKGARIKMLQEKTGVTRIDTTGEIFTITGPPDSVAQCEAAIKELIEKGFCAMMYDNFAESFINVHPNAFPDIIGKQGAILRKIKDELNVEVSIPEVPKGSPPGKKFKVTLAGSAEAVEKAKNAINDIVMYSHSELTHPGQVHEELDIEPWAYRFIIGKAGSEMKHIQHNWSVRVNIPRENSANEKVLIVGEREKVDRAKAYIEKLVWNAENQAKGRDKEDIEATADPSGGDEGADEEWAKTYLYKR